MPMPPMPMNACQRHCQTGLPSVLGGAILGIRTSARAAFAAGAADPAPMRDVPAPGGGRP